MTAIVVAVIALIGTVFTAILNYMSNKSILDDRSYIDVVQMRMSLMMLGKTLLHDSDMCTEDYNNWVKAYSAYERLCAKRKEPNDVMLTLKKSLENKYTKNI